MIDHIIIGGFIKKVCKQLFSRVDDNDDLKGKTVTCRRWI